MEDYILLDVDESEYVYDLRPNNPIILGENPEVGVKNIFLWYTYPNISEKYENDTIKVGAETVKLPEGLYDVDQINEFLAARFEDSVYFKVNLSTFRVRVVLKNNVKIDLTEGLFHKMLGLEPKVYDESEDGVGIINITRGVDRILIRCNLVHRPYQDEFRDVLYDLLPIGQPGSALHENIETVEYHKCKNKVIRQIVIRITDQKNNLIKMTENVSIKLAFRSS